MKKQIRPGDLSQGHLLEGVDWHEEGVEHAGQQVGQDPDDGDFGMRKFLEDSFSGNFGRVVAEMSIELENGDGRAAEQLQTKKF